MRVVYLADAPYVHTRRWIEHFVRAGFDCQVISFRPARIEGARVHHIESAPALGKGRYLVHAHRVRRLVEDLQPDLVHAMHLTSYGFLGAYSGTRPLLLSVEGLDVLEAPYITPLHRWLTRYALSRAQGIAATGLQLAVHATRFAPLGAAVTVVPYGADLDRFAPGHRELRGQVVIGAASRLSPEKGVRYLVEAFAQLYGRFGERVRLRLAGDGPERRKLELIADRLGIANSVEFRGWVEHDDLPAFLQDLDIFVLPSSYEGFGVSAVEASATALPVVATNVHGIPDVVSDERSGLLVPPKDPRSLATAIGRLVEDGELRRRLGEGGRDYVSARYDWRQNAAQMLRLYERILDGREVEARTWS